MMKPVINTDNDEISFLPGKNEYDDLQRYSNKRQSTVLLVLLLLVLLAAFVILS